ncbi:hypothetical protein LUW77_25710 [Streptomyces radiopugnans]|nr:hypothetical protein LUW77_25710 [Streptomyces radiopugnans]
MRDSMDGHAEGEGRVYQALGDQHISEHHHHHGGGEPGPDTPDSVRHPAVGRPPVVLRDRLEVLERLRESAASGRGCDIHVLHGLGGCGKTAVAYDFFRSATGELGLA